MTPAGGQAEVCDPLPAADLLQAWRGAQRTGESQCGSGALGGGGAGSGGRLSPSRPPGLQARLQTAPGPPAPRRRGQNLGSPEGRGPGCVHRLWAHSDAREEEPARGAGDGADTGAGPFPPRAPGRASQRKVLLVLRQQEKSGALKAQLLPLAPRSFSALQSQGRPSAGAGGAQGYALGAPAPGSFLPHRLPPSPSPGVPLPCPSSKCKL